MARAARLASSSWVHIDSSSCSQHGTPTNGTGRGSWGNTHWQDCACPSAARPLLPAAEWLLLLRLLRIAWPPPPPPPSSCAPPTCCAGKPGRKYPPAFAIGEAHMQANCLVQLVVLKRQAAGAHWGREGGGQLCPPVRQDCRGAHLQQQYGAEGGVAYTLLAQERLGVEATASGHCAPRCYPSGFQACSNGHRAARLAATGQRAVGTAGLQLLGLTWFRLMRWCSSPSALSTSRATAAEPSARHRRGAATAM